MHLTLTPEALLLLLRSESWPGSDPCRIPEDLRGAAIAVHSGEVCSIFVASDEQSTRLITVIDQKLDGWSMIAPSQSDTVWQRISRLATLASRKRLEMPHSWAQYRVDNRVAFAAMPLTTNRLRWVSEYNVSGSSDLVMWFLYDLSNGRIPLEDVVPDYELYRSARDIWFEKRRSALDELSRTPSAAKSRIGPNATIDLDDATFGAVTQGRSFDDWKPQLTLRQAQFVDSPMSSMKLRGPAGSGKTLTLQMKLLQELYRARLAGKQLRLLFATHSWSVAEQIDEALRMLDVSGTTAEIDVMPLLAVAESMSVSDYGRYQLLGSDSDDGKRLQLDEIARIVKDISSGDWLAFERRVSPRIAQSVTADVDSTLRRSLCWDLMNEFNTVLAANSILPGVNARERYRQVSRLPWMMSLVSDGDRDFVLLVYTEFVRALRSREMLTTDQLLLDFLNYLETFAWNIRRESDGYDAIFVDELHMFTEQERFVLQFLSRDADRYPVLFMALDPRQSPSEVYVNVDPDALSRQVSGASERGLGDVTSVELDTIHRFSPQILSLVRHINHWFPAFDLGSEWELDLTTTKTTASESEVPQLYLARNRTQQIRAITQALDDSTGMRTAVVVLDGRDLYDYVGYVMPPAGQKLSVIDGRDAVENLRYAKKSIVVSAAEYVGGLQFDRVYVVIGASSSAALTSDGANRRRLASLMYLALSRASRAVTFFCATEFGGVPAVLESASNEGLIEVVTG